MLPTVARLALALFLMQAGFHGYTASLPVALSRNGLPDSEIGLIVGLAAIVQIPAALVAGALIDRFGGIRLFLAGGLAYAAASALMLLPGLDASVSLWPFLAIRLLQGTGIGFALPAALSVVPKLVSSTRHGLALAVGGLSHNLTLVVFPPLSLIVLDVFGLSGVSLLVLGSIAIAFTLVLARPFERVARPAEMHGNDRPKFRFVYRREWLAPLAITLLFSAHWGVVTAYLPQRAEAVGASVGLFFAADGIGVLLTRIPSGWLADRVAPLRPMLVGIAITAVGVGLLLLQPSTPLLIVAGLCTGGGAAFITTPLLVALSHRSSDADRGSAFAFFSAVFAISLTIGSVGAAPVIDQIGFESALALALGALVLSALVALLDRPLSVPSAQPVEPAEIELAPVPPVS